MFRFSHENISKHEIKKFIRDNEQFILELRGKNGKTKIDNEINEYLRNKNKNRNKITNKSFDIMNNMNNNLNCQMINNSLNSLIAMNYLLLQNHFILQQNNQQLINKLKNNITIQQNKNELNKNSKNITHNIEKRDKNNNICHKNGEIFKKILEAVKIPKKTNKNKKINHNDPRKKEKAK